MLVPGVVVVDVDAGARAARRHARRRRRVEKRRGQVARHHRHAFCVQTDTNITFTGWYMENSQLSLFNFKMLAPWV